MKEADRKHRFPIRKSDIEKHGPTDGCDACIRALVGDTQRAQKAAGKDLSRHWRLTEIQGL